MFGLLLSMWMSNTATAMMMLPIVFSVTAALEETHGAQKLRKFTTAILFGWHMDALLVELH
jgi:sodium-dependent dicarboxylate transporter 2/3/5